jgi:hypothetical protein
MKEPARGSPRRQHSRLSHATRYPCVEYAAIRRSSGLYSRRRATLIAPALGQDTRPAPLRPPALEREAVARAVRAAVAAASRPRSAALRQRGGRSGWRRHTFRRKRAIADRRARSIRSGTSTRRQRGAGSWGGPKRFGSGAPRGQRLAAGPYARARCTQGFLPQGRNQAGGACPRVRTAGRRGASRSAVRRIVAKSRPRCTGSGRQGRGNARRRGVATHGDPGSDTAGRTRDASRVGARVVVGA